MGEIADMVLDGMLCESCGGYIDDAYEGIPRKCGDCASAQSRDRGQIKESCQHCKRMVKRVGMRDHIRAVHLGVVKDVK